MANVNPTHVVTGKVRLSYTHLFQPFANPNGGDPKYSTTILVPKSDVLTKQRIDAAIAAATEKGVSDKWNGVRPPVVAICVHDGDGPRPSDGMPFGEECKGHWVFTASGKNPPGVVDINLNPVLDQSEVYSGMYARVGVDFFPYANSGKKGIGCGLANVQKIADGEPLGSRTSAADDFGDYLPAPQQQYAPPPQYAPAPPQQYAPAAPTPQYAINPLTGQPYGG